MSEQILAYPGQSQGVYVFLGSNAKPLQKALFQGTLATLGDWENNLVPAAVEMQLGKSFSRSFGAYIDGMAGPGSDRAYDWGVGVGLRFNY